MAMYYEKSSRFEGCHHRKEFVYYEKWAQPT
jgi:hypothetical protein